MWLFTIYGFFSIVCAKKLDRGKLTEETDTGTVLVRSRTKKHLQDLIAAYREILGGLKIKSEEGTDYPYRVVIRKSQLVQLLIEYAHDIDFTNFKAVVGDRDVYTEGGEAYLDALHDVWERMRQLTPNPQKNTQKVKGLKKRGRPRKVIDDGYFG